MSYGPSFLGLQMDKFRRISTELWPLIYVKISFPLSTRAFIDRFSSNCIGVHIRKEWFGIADC